jgi:hypothetical protein
MTVKSKAGKLGINSEKFKKLTFLKLFTQPKKQDF